jgi:hypothetical protein
MMKLKSFQLFCRKASSILAGSLTLAFTVNAIQPDRAAAVVMDLDFSNLDLDPALNQVLNVPNDPILDLGTGISNNIIYYKDVATGYDAKVTATVNGVGYTFKEHFPNYSQAIGEPSGDAGFLYEMEDGSTGEGGLTYTIDFFESGSNYSNAKIAPNLRFLVYDVDGDALQSEAVRILKNSGLIGYQVGNQANSLIASQDANSYLFSAGNTNYPENDASGAAIFYFQNVNSVTFNFEANTTAQNPFAPNEVFSALDGNLSLIGGNPTSEFGAIVFTTAVPEPFTIIGTLVGGTAALRMRKKLKASIAG